MGAAQPVLLQFPQERPVFLRVPGAATLFRDDDEHHHHDQVDHGVHEMFMFVITIQGYFYFDILANLAI